MSLFEKASRQKFRFITPQGPLSTEDLWDLPLSSQKGRANLDDIARDLNKQLKSGDDVSFVNQAKKAEEVLQQKFDLVKHVIGVKLAENEAVAKARETAEKKQRILALLAEKQDQALAAKSEEELRKMVEAM